MDSPILSFLDEHFQFCVVILNHVVGNFHERKANYERGKKYQQLLAIVQRHECPFMSSSLSNVIFCSNTQILLHEIPLFVERNTI